MINQPKKVGRPTTIPDVRNRIRDAALELFGQRGFEGTSVGDIATLAGVAKANVLYHYGTKDDLWRDAVDHLYAQIDAFFAEKLPEQREASIEAFAKGVRIYLEACLKWPPYVQLNNLEGHSNSWRMEYLAERHLRKHVLMTRMRYDQLVAAGVLPDVDPLFLQNLIAGGGQLLLGQYQLWRTATRSQQTPEEFADFYVDNLVRTFRHKS